MLFEGERPHKVRQSTDHVINISKWLNDEDFPILTVGSKPKRVVRCPASETADYLIPGHRYMFKRADSWQIYQSWSEIIAYEIARAVNAYVPPAFAAIDEEGNFGVLIEFFYGFNDQVAETRLVHAADQVEGVFFDKRGRPHGIQDNIAICRLMKVKNRLPWWARTLAFDAIIGNTDRHPENWGFLHTTLSQTDKLVQLTPLYDNGTSLGYQVQDHKLVEASSPERILQYIARGKHHCGWNSSDDVQAQHGTICKRLADTYPSTRQTMLKTWAIDDEEIASIMTWATRFHTPLKFSEARANFVAGLLRTRRTVLVDLIKEEE